MTTYQVVCTIDIGHTSTGYAYGYSSDSDCTIHINREWSSDLGIPSNRTPTTILINPSGQCEEFGYDAEYKYSKLCAVGEQSGRCLYRHFKRQLFNKQNVTKDSMVRATNGKEISALIVYKMTLEFLKERVVSDMSQGEHSIPDEKTIQWVMTVPTSYTGETKVFLKEAACRAGLISDTSSDQLVLLEESDVTALYCNGLRSNQIGGSSEVIQNGINIQTGSKYMVIDAGGYTVNMTACEVGPHGDIIQLRHVCLEDCGATSIDSAFLQLLSQVFSDKLIKDYSNQNPDLWFQHIEIMFEKQKRSNKPDGEDMVTIPINKNFEQFYNNANKESSIGEVIKKARGKGIYTREDNLTINPTAIFQLYQPTLNRINKEINIMLKSTELNDLKYIFLVGGFIESEFLKKALSGGLSKYQLVIPNKPETVLMRSAVWCGCKQVDRFEVEMFSEDVSADARAQDTYISIPDVDFKVVCAIDFGTTYSGFAYGESGDLDSIIMNKEWENHLGLSCLKNATTVLTGPNGEFEEFGFEAEFKYSKLCSIGDSKDRDLYRNFKMLLHKKQDLTRETMVTSIKGTKRPAFDIFVMALDYLKERFLAALGEKDGVVPNIDMIRWVITVPAIWNDRAKQFMREAAKEAGLIREVSSRQLLYALEPEAAAFYCQEMKRTGNLKGHGNSEEAGAEFSVGTKYMIIDAGGGTVDITAQEVLPDHKIKQLVVPSGGDWGGNKINAKFEELMTTIFGEEFIQTYQMSNPDGWLQLEVDFEKKKRANVPSGYDTLTFPISRNLERSYREITGQEIDQAINKYSNLGVYVANDNIVINPNAVSDLYYSTFSLIIPCVSDLLSSPKLKDLKHIFLVGGFAESEFLKRAISTEFKNFKVLIPEHSGTAVLRGAVIFGHNTEIVTSRIAKKYYGIAVNEPFKEGKHDNRKKILDENNKAFCQDVFETYITKGEEVNIGDWKLFTLHPFLSTSMEVRLNLYCTEKDSVMYVDEDGVELVGELIIPLLNKTGGKDRVIKVKVYFGGTEIVVECCDQTSDDKVQRVELKCLSSTKTDYAVVRGTFRSSTWKK